MVNISTEVLPEFPLFLAQLISATQKNEKPQHDAWNREATMLLHGTSGMEILAKNEGNKRPRIYVDWIQGLIDDKNYKAALSAAERALKQLPPNKPICAAIADLMVFCGSKLNDRKTQHDGEWFSFKAKPSLLKLTKLYELCDNKHSIESQMRLASKIIETHIET
jgi:hypothetical protein